MAGIKETKELLKFLAEVGEAGVKRTLPEIVEALQAAYPAIQGIKDVITEIKDLDQAELDELVQYFAEEFDLEDDKAELAVEKGLNAIKSIVEFINLIS